MIVNSGNLKTLNTGFNAAFKAGFEQAKPDHAPITLEVTSTTAVEEYGWLGQVPSLRQWVGERVLQGIKQHGYSIKNEKFESTIEVSRDDIEDDRIGVYAPLFSELGRAAAAHPCELVYDLLKAGFTTPCYDGQYFFDNDHPVNGEMVSNTGGGAGTPWFLADCSRMIKPIIFQRRRNYDLKRMDTTTDEQVFMTDTYRYGVDARVNAGFGLWQLCYASKANLNAANYKAARKALHEMTGDEGRKMGVRPTHLFVPSSLEGAALELLNAERNAAGATNVWRGTAQLVVTPWLS